jgi:hypothetical protein
MPVSITLLGRLDPAIQQLEASSRETHLRIWDLIQICETKGCPKLVKLGRPPSLCSDLERPHGVSASDLGSLPPSPATIIGKLCATRRNAIPTAHPRADRLPTPKCSPLIQSSYDQRVGSRSPRRVALRRCLGSLLESGRRC